MRESWATEQAYDHLPPSQIPHNVRIWYLADGERPAWAGKKRPSIHMPRWASRLTLRLTEVRVERIQDISTDDVVAEGIGRYTLARGATSEVPPDPRWKFIALWDSINGERAGCAWDANPWVWVLAFEVLDKSGTTPE